MLAQNCTVKQTIHWLWMMSPQANRKWCKWQSRMNRSASAGWRPNCCTTLHWSYSQERKCSRPLPDLVLGTRRLCSFWRRFPSIRHKSSHACNHTVDPSSIMCSGPHLVDVLRIFPFDGVKPLLSPPCSSLPSLSASSSSRLAAQIYCNSISEDNESPQRVSVCVHLPADINIKEEMKSRFVKIVCQPLHVWPQCWSVVEMLVWAHIRH